MTPERAKAFGAFYTDAVVAEFLVRWAVRRLDDAVLDPSFGGGVFLAAAAARVSRLGGAPERLVYGVELDDEVHAQSQGLTELTGISPQNLICSDFFAVELETLPQLAAVVGNPPFIRYQSFSGTVRTLAAERARAQGVTLTNLASSWAAFVVHSAAFLKPGGRLGMVVPAELGHAAYGRPVLAFLTRTFGHVTLLSFRERLFPEISQDTLLLLAEAKNAPFEGFFWRDMENAEALRQPVASVLGRLETLPTDPLSDEDRLITRLISAEARTLYRRLSEHPHVSRLGRLAEVGIGYVTGANAFFHLSPEKADSLGLPESQLSSAVFRGAALSGSTFIKADWQDAARTKNAGYLLHISDKPTPELAAYLAEGEAAGVHEAYKCRVRASWYCVPHVYTPDAFLTYMSGLRPQLVANCAGAVAPNTLHVVRFKPTTLVEPATLAAFWQTSLTSLSVELEGHALGGGMLKLEPSEARRVLIASPGGNFSSIESELDALLRQGKVDEAQNLADRVLLQDGLGLDKKACAALRDAAHLLRDRRYYRGKVRAVSGRIPASPQPPPAS